MTSVLEISIDSVVTFSRLTLASTTAGEAVRYLVQLEEGDTTLEGEGLGHLLARRAVLLPHLLLLLLPEPGAAWLWCPGRVVQCRDQVCPQGHPLAVQVVAHPGYTFQGQIPLFSQGELGPGVDSAGLAVEQGDLGLAGDRQNRNG